MPAKKFLQLLKKKLVYSLLIVPHSSANKVKSCYVPVPFALLIICFIIFNVYIFFGYSVQIWQINRLNHDIANKRHLITKLSSEKKLVAPSLEQNRQIIDELKLLINGQESLDTTLNRIRKKKGRSILLASRGLFVRTPPYELSPLLKTEEVVTSLECLNHNLEELNKYVQAEKEAQNKFLNELQVYEYRLDHTPTIWPVNSSIVGRFGMRFHPIYKKYRPHRGLDIAAGYGVPVHATADGTVSFAGWENGYGYLVKINHGNGYETRYGHNSLLLVYPGQKVKKGQKISLAGATGDATGPHVHYEVRINNNPRNPAPFLSN